ncbi:MAG: PaaI family thioesterase [Pseudomonadota bacterium]
MSTYQPFSVERAYGVADADMVSSMTGLEFLQAMQEGRIPSAGISKELQIDLVEVEEGRVVFAGKPSAGFYNPLGTVHGGWPSTLLDSCMGCAIHSTLPAPAQYTTLELKVNFIRPIFEKTGVVRAEGLVVHAGRRTATAEGRLVDETGKLYAHGSTTCLVL